MKEFPKTYDPKKVEDKIYKKWEESGYFNPDNLNGDPYSIMMPPPNVTGVLHLGHAMENSIMDIMARYQRMQGRKVLLLPGTDHAAVATQAKVEKVLIEKGIKNPRKYLGRAGLLKEIKEYAENSKSTIISQIKKMGTSCDWDRLAYTFDEKRNKAVNAVFEKMHKDKLIYRGYKTINWSVKGQSTCSDDELEYKERVGKFYTFKYSKDFPISIATTRPETKLGDSAVAVNPKDKRYKNYIGQSFKIKNFAESGIDLNIKIIANKSVDPEFGTGAVGVTPAHSMVDFDMYERQKAKRDPINLIQVIGPDGKMNNNAGKYKDILTEKAREKIVKSLKKNNLIEKEEEIPQNVSTSDRFGDITEVVPMTQWFVDVNKKIPGKGKSLKNLMKEAVATGHNGDKSQKIAINPKRFEKIYFQWIDNLRDWCISRQVWWGHRLPVWYRLNSDEAGIYDQNPEEHRHFLLDREATISYENPGNKNDKEHWKQDPDTLDTWFSSGLWTFSTLTKEERKIFHPTSWMQMGHEILFFWMARMILMSTYALDEIPFENVYIHGMLRDENGNKFSKSAGNNIDPLEMIGKYGTDALRLGLITGIAPGNDSKFYEEKVENSRNFCNKLWNISRYIHGSWNVDHEKEIDSISLTSADRWIIQKTATLIKEVKTDLNKYMFSQASEKLYNFTWHTFADWYIEISKFEDNKREKYYILNTALKDLLKLWHPFIPFVTEKIWNHLNKDGLLIIENYPDENTYRDKFGVSKDADKINFDAIIEIVQNIRALRAESKIESDKKIDVLISVTKANKDFIKSQESIIKNLRTGVGKIKFISKKEKIENTVSKTTPDGITICVPLEGLIDVKKEKISKEKEIGDLENYISGLEKKLSDKGFAKNAPENIIKDVKEKLEKSKIKLDELQKYLKNLK